MSRSITPKSPSGDPVLIPVRPACHKGPVRCRLDCGHQVLFTVVPFTGDVVWCLRCDCPATVT